MIRKKWLSYLNQIALPVLKSLSQDRLKQELPNEFHPDRANFAPLEAFGRTLAGIGPWIELNEITDPSEKQMQVEYRDLIIQAMEHAVNPEANDFMDFQSDGQPLVDAAFLAHFIVRAPNFSRLAFTGKVGENLINALKSTRHIIPYNMNWNLFSAMVEGALAVLESDYDLLRVIYAIRLLDDWYLGDGVYGDGPNFHWDYYNSYVIQPMAIDLLDLFAEENKELANYREKMLPRFSRHAVIQERLIAPDGSFPIIGRSITYRYGAFQLLAQAALQNRLPEDLKSNQVRTALNAVIEKVHSSDDLFDDKGWLQVGVFGHQPDLAEPYISVGSLYLTSFIYLPLGLAESHPFWSGPETDWTAKKVWSGVDVKRDESV